MKRTKIPLKLENIEQFDKYGQPIYLDISNFVPGKIVEIYGRKFKMLKSNLDLIQELRKRSMYDEKELEVIFNLALYSK